MSETDGAVSEAPKYNVDLIAAPYNPYHPQHHWVVRPRGQHVVTASYCTKADATLYAAAPALVEALSDLLSQIEAATYRLGQPLVNPERAIAALRLATGETE